MSGRSTKHIQQQIFEWLSRVEDADGEISEAAEAQLDNYLVDVDDKAKGLFFVKMRCKSMQAEADEMAEVARIQKDKWKRREAKIMGYFKNLLDVKAMAGEEARIYGNWGTCYILKTESVYIEDFDSIDPKWLKEKVTLKLDKTKVKESLKDGFAVSGCSLKTKHSAVIVSKK